MNTARVKRTNAMLWLIWLGLGLTLLMAKQPVGAWPLMMTGAACLGWASGLLGTQLLVRRMSLMGDAVGHAVWPGVVAAYLLTDSRNLAVILPGALISAFLGVLTIHALQRSTRIKADLALAMVLAVFFAAGVALKSKYQAKSLDSFLFGQMAVMDGKDFQWMAWMAWGVSGILMVGHRVFMVSSFDEIFARSMGISTRLIHLLMYGMLALQVVVALQAVGVVLVSALLVIPAATAFLCSRRLARVSLLAGGIGFLSGILGVALSFSHDQWATGPMIVMSAGALFVLALLLAPQQGWLSQAWSQRRTRLRISRENTLKAIHRVMEDAPRSESAVSLQELAQHRRQTLEECEDCVKSLHKVGLLKAGTPSDLIRLNDEGLRRAQEIVRNHRLWELYLSKHANYAGDHVHEDAEWVEHWLSSDEVRALETQLDFPVVDPHGRPIPLMQQKLNETEGSDA